MQKTHVIFSFRLPLSKSVRRFFLNAVKEEPPLPPAHPVPALWPMWPPRRHLRAVGIHWEHPLLVGRLLLIALPLLVCGLLLIGLRHPLLVLAGRTCRVRVLLAGRAGGACCCFRFFCLLLWRLLELQDCFGEFPGEFFVRHLGDWWRQPLPFPLWAPRRCSGRCLLYFVLLHVGFLHVLLLHIHVGFLHVLLLHLPLLRHFFCSRPCIVKVQLHRRGCLMIGWWGGSSPPYSVGNEWWLNTLTWCIC